MVKIPQILIILMWLSQLTGLWQVFDISGYGVQLGDLIIAAMILSVAYQIFIEKKQFHLERGPLTTLLFLSIFAAFISGISLIFWGGSVEITQFFKSFIHYIFYIFFALLFTFSEVDDDAFYNTIKIVLILAFFVNIFGIYQIFARLYNLPLAWLDITNVSFEQRGMKEIEGETEQLALRFGNFYRATSIFPEPSALAYYNVFNLAYIVVPFLRGSKPFIKNPIFNLMVFISIILGLLTPFSLGGLSGVLLFMFLLIIIEKIKIRRFVLPIVLLLITIMIFDNYFYQQTQTSIINLFYERVSGLLSSTPGVQPIAGESTYGRLDSFKNAFEIFLTSPLIGIGIGNTYYHQLSEIRFASSSVFSILAEMGIFGLIIFFFLIYFGIKYGMFLRKSEVIANIQNDKLNTVQSIVVYAWILIVFDALALASIHGTTALWMPLVVLLATHKSVLKNLRQNNFDFEKYNLSDYNI